MSQEPDAVSRWVLRSGKSEEKKRGLDFVGLGLQVSPPTTKCTPRGCQSAPHTAPDAAHPGASSQPTGGSRDVTDQAAQATPVLWGKKSPQQKSQTRSLPVPEAAEFSYGGFLGFFSECLLFSPSLTELESGEDAG